MTPSRREQGEHYHQEAERLRSLAETTHDPEVRHQLLDIARQYETLAQELLSGW